MGVFYWPGPSNPLVGVPSPLAGATGDWGVLDDARDRLKASGEFDGVYRSALPEEKGRPSGDRLAAVVAPADWEQTDESDDEEEVQSTRRVHWTLTLIVRDDDPETRERTLDRLLAVSQNALDGQALGGITIPDWTRLRRGRYGTPSGPEQRMTVTGEFAYWVAGFNSNQTED